MRLCKDGILVNENAKYFKQTTEKSQPTAIALGARFCTKITDCKFSLVEHKVLLLLNMFQ